MNEKNHATAYAAGRQRAALLLILPVAVASVMLAGCTVIPGPRGQSYQPSTLQHEFAASPNNADQSAEDIRVERAVIEILAAKGFVKTRRADLILDIGLSERDRRIGFSTEAGAPAPPTRAIGESRARQGDALAVCKEKIVRLTITLMSQSQRQVAYQGSADDLRCAAPDDDNLKALANVALANLRVTHSRVSD